MSENDDTESSDRWTVRRIDQQTQNIAKAAAKRERLSIGEWLTRAIRAHAEAGIKPIDGGQTEPVGGQLSDLVETRSIVDMIAQLSGAGLDVPVSVTEAAYGLLLFQLETIRKQGPAAQA
jgi:hypothetical protein